MPVASESEATAELGRLINAERQRWGLEPLAASEALEAAARIRVSEIHLPLSHDRPSGTLMDLLDNAGLEWLAAGENLAMIVDGGPADAARRAHGRFMANPVHRDNLMSGDYRYVGVSAALRNGRWYFVQLFLG
jgi:uncharacterized protein YkwD